VWLNEPNYCEWALKKSWPQGGLRDFVEFLRQQPARPSTSPASSSDSSDEEEKTPMKSKATSRSRANRIIAFGKHEGRSFNDVWLNEPNYCEWALKKSWPQGGLRDFVEFLRQQPARPSSSAPVSSNDTSEEEKRLPMMSRVLPPEGACTESFTVERDGRRVPLVGMARRDGFGRLAVQLVYSDHEGLDALRPHAHDFGYGRGKPATKAELQRFARNPEYAWSFLSMPMHDGAVRAKMRNDEVVVHSRNCSEELAAMLRGGLAVDTRRRCSQGYYEDLPIVRVKLA